MSKKNSINKENKKTYINQQIFKSRVLRWFIFLAPVVILSQYFLLLPQQHYGFYDVDWGYLWVYKSIKYGPYSLRGFIDLYSWQGAYGHQAYYVGTLVSILGYNFQHIQIATQVFKTLGILLFFIVVSFLIEDPLLAFVSSLVLAFSYTTIASLSNVVIGADYVGIALMISFFWTYAKVIKQNYSYKFVIPAFFFLYASLLLDTIRIFPIIFIVLLVQAYFIIQHMKKWRKILLFSTILFLPTLLAFALYPSAILSYIGTNGPDHISRIIKGDYRLELEPFIALGSNIIPFNYWPLLGQLPYEPGIPQGFLYHHLGSYWLTFRILKYIFPQSLVTFAVITIFLSYPLFKNWIGFTKRVLISYIICGVFAGYLMGNGSTNTLDPSFYPPSLIGIYVLIFGIFSFFEWKKEKNLLQIGLFTGPIFSFIWISITWLGSSNIPFIAPHRYLTTPSVWTSFFIGTLVVLIFKGLKKKKYPFIIQIVPFLFLIPLLYIDLTTIPQYFSYELQNGYRASDQIRMRKELSVFLYKLPTDKPSFFYFDKSNETQNSLFYANTLTSGLPSWILWNNRINFNQALAPDLTWDNMQFLKSAVTRRKGTNGLLIRNVFYSPSHFYAFKLKNKKVYNITGQVLRELNLD